MRSVWNMQIKTQANGIWRILAVEVFYFSATGLCDVRCIGLILPKGKREAQRGDMTCPRSCMWGLNSGWPGSNAFDYDVQGLIVPGPTARNGVTDWEQRAVGVGERTETRGGFPRALWLNPDLEP